MQPQHASIRQCLSQGWTAFGKNANVAIPASLLYTGLNAVAMCIPVFNLLYLVYGVFPLLGGYVSLFLNITRGRPHIGWLFTGWLESRDRWNRAGWHLVACTLGRGFILAIAFLPLVVVAALLRTGPASTSIEVIAVVAFPVLWGLSVVRWAFTFHVMADQDISGKEAMKVSALMTKGVRPHILAVLLVARGVALAGVLALGVGVLVTVPLAECVISASYLSLRDEGESTPQSGLPL